MCGISGYFSNLVSEEELHLSVQSIKHRGPDYQNIWIGNGVGLGHSRLSILDLSDLANQPMQSHSGRHIMVFNGEIYNFKQLAQKFHIETNTTSDSEVLLELFEQVGTAFVNELNGMFAIAIFDKEQNVLYLFRDRLGIKPLFYFFDGQQLIFASELKALMVFNAVKQNLKINSSSIYQFLNLGYIAEPHTFFQNIYKFPSGSYATFSNQTPDIKPFWKLESKITEKPISDLNTAKAGLKERLLKSVERRMISDVPLGTFLSGGVDSSLITALAQEISPHPVKTFSIGFKESRFNESVYARKVAQHLKTDHHEFIVSEKHILELVDQFFTAYDEPYADSSGFPTLLVSQLAKKEVSVILSGDGGDELFHGYGMYNWAKRLNNPLIQTLRKPIALGLNQFTNRHKRAALVVDYLDKKNLKSHIFSQEQYCFSERELQSVLINNTPKHLDEALNTKRILTPSEAQSVFDIKHYLKDVLLVKVDRASMQSALEVRVPLLDHEVVEYALNIDPKLKMNNGVQKYLLKQVLYDYLPKELFDRPKWGFAIPMEKWLKTDLNYLLERYTSKAIIEQYNLLSYPKVEELKRKYNAGQSYWYNRLWLIIVLHRFLEQYNPLLKEF